MQTERMPEILVFAGPNGSGKSTVTKAVNLVGDYINADDIKKALDCSDMEAAIKADERRRKNIEKKVDFTFETVLSTDRNLLLLQEAKNHGYFIKCFYILTADPLINLARVKARVQSGGHDVPNDKVMSRYKKALALLPELIDVCDVIHVYDNSETLFRIFKKRKTEYFYWENEYWDADRISKMTKIAFNDMEK